MIHRHLTHHAFTPAAIDDVIDRGGKEDWLELRLAALSDPLVLDRIRRVCAAHLADPYALRYHFWMHYVERSAA
jgi:hypothetical protein